MGDRNLYPEHYRPQYGPIVQNIPGYSVVENVLAPLYLIRQLPAILNVLEANDYHPYFVREKIKEETRMKVVQPYRVRAGKLNADVRSLVFRKGYARPRDISLAEIGDWPAMYVNNLGHSLFLETTPESEKDLNNLRKELSDLVREL